MAHLRKRGNKTYQIVIENGKKPDGSRNIIYKTVHCSKPKARDIMRDMEKEIKEGVYIQDDITFAEQLEDWFQSKNNEWKPTTMESYKQQINNHIIPELGKYELQQLNKKPKIIEDFYNYKLKKGRINGEGGLSKRSVEYLHSIIHASLEAAVKWKRIKTNPANRIDHPTSEKDKEIKYLDTENLNKFLNQVDNKFYKIIFEFAARTGMRRGEILGLQWEYVDFKNKEIKVRQTLQRVNESYIIQESTKNRLIRTVPISLKVMPILKERKKLYNQNKLNFGTKYQDNQLVFARENGKPFSPNVVYKAFKRYAKKAGCKDMTFHGLRHSFASIMLENGAEMKLIQELLGHTEQSTTSDIYSHVSKKMKEEAMKEMDRIL